MARPAANPSLKPSRTRAPKAAPAASSEAAAQAAPLGKLATIVMLMSRPEGAMITELTAATCWLPHSVRGAIAGALKKTRGLAVTSEPTDQGRVYRIVA